jgi:hypothetical protein
MSASSLMPTLPGVEVAALLNAVCIPPKQSLANDWKWPKPDVSANELTGCKCDKAGVAFSEYLTLNLVLVISQLYKFDCQRIK